MAGRWPGRNQRTTPCTSANRPCTPNTALTPSPRLFAARVLFCVAVEDVRPVLLALYGNDEDDEEEDELTFQKDDLIRLDSHDPGALCILPRVGMLAGGQPSSACPLAGAAAACDRGSAGSGPCGCMVARPPARARSAARTRARGAFLFFVGEGWWTGSVHGATGIFPSNLVKGLNTSAV